MRNERTIGNANEPAVLACEDYLIRLFPIFNTALFTGINTAAASIGNAFINEFEPRLAPRSKQDALNNAAISATLGFLIISLGCAFFSTPSTKKNPRDRLSETASLFYPLALADMILSFPLPILTAYFFYNLPIYDAGMIDLNNGIGTNLLLIPMLCGAMLFRVGNHLKSTETTPDDETVEDRARAIVRSEPNPQPANDMPNHTVIEVSSAAAEESDHNDHTSSMSP